MSDSRALGEKLLLCLDMAEAYVRVSILCALFDATDDELCAAWEGFNDEYWPEDQFVVTRPGDPGFRFNHLQPTRVRWW